MSATIATTALNVRIRLRDDDPAHEAIYSDELARILVEKAQRIGGMLGYRPAWSATVFTLTVGSQADYTLSIGGLQADRVLGLRIADTGRTLYPVGWDTIQALREGWTPGMQGNGDPNFYHLQETSAQALSVRIDTIPTSAYTVDALVATVPATAYTDATSLLFSDPALRAIELATAADCLRLMRSEDAEKRGLDKGLADQWYVELPDGRMGGTAGNFVREERYRLARLHQPAVHVGKLSY